MSCNNCNKIVDCGCNTKENCVQQDCSCPIKDLSTDCVLYTGPDLECSKITSDTPLTDLIQQLDEFICEKFDFATEYFQLINIGGGAEVYKGTTLVGQKLLRTIVSENTNHLDVIENADTIGIRGGEHRLEFNSGTDILTLIVNSLIGDSTLSQIDLSQYNYDTFVQNATFNEGTQILTITRNNGEPNIDVDLSFLNNHLISVTYSDVTNLVTFEITDGTTFDLDIAAILADAQIQSDYLESNITSPAHILNRNPSKTVTLGLGGNYNVVATDNNYIIEIDNGANDVTIDITALGLTTEFFVGFIQKGTGLVTFVGYDIKPDSLSDVLYGQGHIAAFEIINSTKYLHGTLKAS